MTDLDALIGPKAAWVVRQIYRENLHRGEEEATAIAASWAEEFHRPDGLLDPGSISRSPQAEHEPAATPAERVSNRPAQLFDVEED